MVKPLTVLQNRVVSLLDDWPEHPGLQKILDVIKMLLGLSVDTPLAKVANLIYESSFLKAIFLEFNTKILMYIILSFLTRYIFFWVGFIGVAILTQQNAGIARKCFKVLFFWWTLILTLDFFPTIFWYWLHDGCFLQINCNQFLVWSHHGKSLSWSLGLLCWTELWSNVILMLERYVIDSAHIAEKRWSLITYNVFGHMEHCSYGFRCTLFFIVNTLVTVIICLQFKGICPSILAYITVDSITLFDMYSCYDSFLRYVHFANSLHVLDPDHSSGGPTMD